MTCSLATMLDSTRCAFPHRSRSSLAGPKLKRRPASSTAAAAAAACTTSLGETYISVASEMNPGSHNWQQYRKEERR